MNVYDFDQTLFYPDSSYTFIRWCMSRHFAAAVRYAPVVPVSCLEYALGLISRKKLKERAFSFVRYVPDLEDEVEKFWDGHEGWLAPWYSAQKRPDDVIISASPEFVIAPMAKRLGLTLIASRLDYRTGKLSGVSCAGEEKVRRFYEAFPSGKIEKFYSDSLNDAPMARLARQAFLVTGMGRKISPWPGL